MMSTRRGKEWAAQNLRDHLGWVLSLFLVGLGAKFLMILKSNSPLPYYDQWEGEAVDVYVPYYQHALALVDLFKAHNEHRIFFTRVYDLLLLLLNGQWDSQLQMTLNAGLHCAGVAGFGWLMAGLLGKARWPLIWPPLALALALPFGWENTLWAFQSQFYFLLIFSLLTMWWLGLCEPFSVRWKLGVAAGALALFTMASGFMAAAATAALCLVDILKDRRNWRRQMPTLIVCGVLIVFELLLKTDVPRHHQLQAQTLRDFVLALGKNLAWPCIFQPWVAPLNVLVFALLGWVYWRSPRDQSMPAERMILLTGFWSILQSAAAAYARGADGSGPAWRYMDVTSFLTIANWLGIVLLLTRHRGQLSNLPLWYAGFAVWTIICLAGFFPLSRLARLDAIPSWAVRQEIRLETTRAFMATDNEHVFDNEDVKNLAFPYAPEYVFLLREQDIRRILPACARDPIKLVRQGTDNGGFVTNGCRLFQAEPAYEKSWGSYSFLGARAWGTFEGKAVRPSTLPFLEIPVAGDLGSDGLALELVELRTGKITPVKVPQAPRGRWLNVYVKAPAGEFKVVAHDDSETKWFAFKEPREVGRLSYWAMRLLGTWKICLAAGAVCLLWGVAGIFRSRATAPL